jgi:hypothetical protein
MDADEVVDVQQDGPEKGATGAPPPAQLFDANELLHGFHVAHNRIGASANRMVQAAANTYALAELLVRKGVIGVDELDATRRTVEGRLREEVQDKVAVRITEGAPDKYDMPDQAVEIDCENRIPLCKGACCRLRFALTEQDIEEGIVHWNLAEPYLNRQSADGYCTHSDSATRGCTIYANRPAVCRGYDCRRDQRIWLDFEQRVPNPKLLELTNSRRLPQVETMPKAPDPA